MLNILIESEDIKLLEQTNNEYNIFFNLEDCNFKILDIVVLDYITPCFEFLTKIKLLKNINKKVKVIVGVKFLERNFIKMLYDNGVDIILIKPLDFNMLLLSFNHFDDLENKIVNNNFKNQVSEILMELGMPANLKGYNYIKDALILCEKDRDYYKHTSSYLYPKLSKMYNEKNSNIEKAIRSAIELCWCRGNIDKQERIFGYTVNKDKGRPTNSEFLAQIYHYIHTN